MPCVPITAEVRRLNACALRNHEAKYSVCPRLFYSRCSSELRYPQKLKVHSFYLSSPRLSVTMDTVSEFTQDSNYSTPALLRRASYWDSRGGRQTQRNSIARLTQRHRNSITERRSPSATGLQMCSVRTRSPDTIMVQSPSACAAIDPADEV
jgi:hypothetical protein